MLAVVMSKNARARSVQLPAWNEALGLPRPWDQQWSLRLQQIVAFETDLLEYGDIFDGSTEIARKVEELKAEASAEMARIADMGGAVAAIEAAYMKQRLVESNLKRLSAIEAGEQTVIGVNAYTEAEPSPLSTGAGAILTVDASVERGQIERLKAWRAGRDGAAVDKALAELASAAKEDRKRLPARSPARAGVPPANGPVHARCSANTPRRPAAARRVSATAGWMRRGAKSNNSLVARRRIKILVGARPNAIPTAPTSPCALAIAAWKWSTRASAWPGASSRRARGERACRRPLDPLGRSCRAGRRGSGRAAPGRHRRRAGGGGRHHPAGRRRGADQDRRGARLHAQGFRPDPDHARHRGGRRSCLERSRLDASFLGINVLVLVRSAAV
jgi:hypothetical protein